MPPKKSKIENAKGQEKAKAKVVEDKTFGLKNKKGKKQQTYIKNVASQVQGNVKNSAKDKDAAPKMTKKELERQKLEELNALFKPVQKAQTVAAGVDPKSVLCNYFKQGSCQKGFRCKFSHDLSIERKSEKKNIYEDTREKEEGMNDWDQQTLEDVVNKKHGSANSTKTEIICKFFLDAVEKGLYGWFWNCPNGNDKCMYRHALPPGFVLKKDAKRAEEMEVKVSLEEHIENERNQLSGNLTPVNKETFLAWKKRKIEEKKENAAKELKQKKEAFKLGKGMASGKEVFLFKPELANADDDEADDEIYTLEREGDEDGDDGGPCTEIDVDLFSQELGDDTATDDSKESSITKFSTLLPKDREMAMMAVSMASFAYDENDTSETDITGAAAACAAPEPPAAATDAAGDVEIDESLFEDLDDLDLEDGD